MALVLMCGLSFAGKSTAARAISERLGCDVVSLDRINAERGLDGGQGIPVEEWATTNSIARQRVVEMLRSGRHVVVDDTGSPRFIRDDWRTTAAGCDAAFVVVWVRIDETTQRARVAANRVSGARSDVVDRVLAEHRAAFEEPGADENPIVVDGADCRDMAVMQRVAASVAARS